MMMMMMNIEFPVLIIYTPPKALLTLCQSKYLSEDLLKNFFYQKIKSLAQIDSFQIMAFLRYVFKPQIRGHLTFATAQNQER